MAKSKQKNAENGKIILDKCQIQHYTVAKDAKYGIQNHEGRHNVLRNLEAEITRKKLSREEIASGIGISTRSLYDKLNGKSKFNVEEAFTLQRIFFPDKDIDYLFEQTDR